LKIFLVSCACVGPIGDIKIWNVKRGVGLERSQVNEVIGINDEAFDKKKCVDDDSFKKIKTRLYQLEKECGVYSDSFIEEDVWE
jgi:hypothetical protein